MSSTLTIDCYECQLQHSDACQDCLVSFVIDRDPKDALIIDVEEERAVRMLEKAGLLPRLRFAERVS